MGALIGFAVLFGAGWAVMSLVALALAHWDCRPADRRLGCGCEHPGYEYTCMYCSRSHCGAHTEHTCDAKTAMAVLTPDDPELDEHGRRYIAYTLAFLDADPNRWFDRHQAMRRESYVLSRNESEVWKRLVNDDFKEINQ